jgi:D-alanine-D-alanine ligase
MNNERMKLAIILHNPVSGDSKEDELDVLNQAELIETALFSLGYTSERMEFSLNIQNLLIKLKEKHPDIVFNLVETVNNTGRLSFMAPAALESSGLIFTGSGTEAIFTTTDKVICKTLLRANRIETPEWAKNLNEIDPGKIYITKPIAEDGSVGIEDNILLQGNQVKTISYGSFAEEYIHGREFNISVIGGKDGPLVLPPAEMCFNNYSDSKPRILGYKAKWEENSFEYKNTTRSFNFEEQDRLLFKGLKGIAQRCWQIFDLRGYARVDVRVGNDLIPKVIEINANPCIAPDSGFIAACKEAGLTETDVIKRIIEDAKRE